MPRGILATFCAQPASAPGTCRPLGAKRPERHAGGGGSPTRWKEMGWHHSSTPHGQGCGLCTFLPGGAASRRASTKTATQLCLEKPRHVAQPRRKYAQKVQCERCVVDLSAMVSQIAWFIRLCGGFSQCLCHGGVSHDFYATARAQSVCTPNLTFGLRFSIYSCFPLFISAN